VCFFLLENFLTMETKKNQKFIANCTKGFFGKRYTKVATFWRKEEEEEEEVAYFRHLSSCKSPKLGGISKSFYCCVQPLAKFGWFLLWILMASPPTWQNWEKQFPDPKWSKSNQCIPVFNGKFQWKIPVFLIPIIWHCISRLVTIPWGIE